MKFFYEVLSQCPLFYGMEASDLDLIAACLNGKTITVPKGNPVFLEGNPAQFTGVVLSGSVQVIREDYNGNRSILTILRPGEVFGEVFSFAGLEFMPVSAAAVSDSEVLLLDCRRILTPCFDLCDFHIRLMKNLLQEMARKNLELSGKIRYMSQKSTKEKLMAFLLDQAKQHGSAEFAIPYDRQALADYLGVERSAMSAEIGKLKKAGLIDTKGSRFCIKPAGGFAGRQ